MTVWHYNIGKRAVRLIGGVPVKGKHYDGVKKGKPVEVKAVRKDGRFRINFNPHKLMLLRDGVYVFVNSNLDCKVLTASRVSKLLGSGKWFEDRSYPHKFIKVEEVF